MNLKKIGKVFTSKFVGTGPSSYKKIIYRAAVSQRLRNTDLGDRISYEVTNRRKGDVCCWFVNPLKLCATHCISLFLFCFSKYVWGGGTHFDLHECPYRFWANPVPYTSGIGDSFPRSKGKHESCHIPPTRA